MVEESALLPLHAVPQRRPVESCFDSGVFGTYFAFLLFRNVCERSAISTDSLIATMRSLRKGFYHVILGFDILGNCTDRRRSWFRRNRRHGCGHRQDRVFLVPRVLHNQPNHGSPRTRRLDALPRPHVMNGEAATMIDTPPRGAWDTGR